MFTGEIDWLHCIAVAYWNLNQLLYSDSFKPQLKEPGKNHPDKVMPSILIGGELDSGVY